MGGETNDHPKKTITTANTARQLAVGRAMVGNEKNHPAKIARTVNIVPTRKLVVGGIKETLDGAISTANITTSIPATTKTKLTPETQRSKNSCESTNNMNMKGLNARNKNKKDTENLPQQICWQA